jgi:deoxyribose-phosphate aldolase
MKLTTHDIARSMDISALKIDTNYQDLLDMVSACKKYDIGCAFIWAGFSADMGKMLKGTNTEFGTSLSFPSGQEITEAKVEQAKYFMSLGADQIDMVMNVGFLKSGFYDRCYDDVMAVRKATKGFSMKVIIEAMLLSDEQIIKACEIVRDCGSDYVKSGTGFQSAPTTLHHVALMKKTVGDRCKVKAAGGVRDLDTLVKMYALGVNRFGIGQASCIKILQQADAYPDGIEVPVLDLEEYAKPVALQASKESGNY